MAWKLTSTTPTLRGLDAVFTSELFVTGYDEEGLWLVHDRGRERIVEGTDDSTRDGSSFFGATALAADAKGRLYVAYDKGEYPDGEIGLATRDHGTWKTQTLVEQEAAIGATGEHHIAIAVTADGKVTVAAGVLKDDRVLTILRPGEKPNKLGIDIDGVAVAVDASGAAHLICNPRDGGLRYGREAKGKWTFEDVPGTSGAPHLSIAIDRAGRPHIAFLDASGKNALFHGVRDDGGWRLTKVDRELNSGFNAKLAFDADDRPCIGHWASKSKYNASSTAIVDTPVRFARQGADGKWSTETVGEAFEWSAFALAPDGVPHFAFSGRSEKLVIARGAAGAPAKPKPGAAKPAKTTAAPKKATKKATKKK